MPPKKNDAKKAAPGKNETSEPLKKQEEAHDKKAEGKTEVAAKEAKPASSASKPAAKRKKSTAAEESQKAPRRSARGTQKAQPPPEKLLNFLLSSTCTDLCRPKDEQGSSALLRTYTSTVPLTPFEELLSAAILSRPISHALGQRTIRTILNPPYNFRSPKAIKDAGDGKRHQALWDAKTQHKQKTVEQITMLADTVNEKFADAPEDTSLEKLRKEAEYDREVLRETITNSFKGVGRTGVDIFLRRIQGSWKECYPYIDDRTAKGLEQLGLPTYEGPMQKLIDDHWQQLKLDDVQGKDEHEKKRMVFMRVLERALSSDLEGRMDELIQHAMEA